VLLSPKRSGFMPEHIINYTNPMRRRGGNYTHPSRTATHPPTPANPIVRGDDHRPALSSSTCHEDGHRPPKPLTHTPPREIHRTPTFHPVVLTHAPISFKAGRRDWAA